MQLNDRTGGELRILARKIEALWWMSRPGFSNAPILMAIAGWLSVKQFPNLNHLIGLVLFIGLLGSAIVLLNDLLDQDDDTVTAPYLPLPAGLLSRGEAEIGLALTLIGATACLIYISSKTLLFLTNFALMAVAIVAAGAYCVFKHTGFLASVLMSIPYVIFVTLGWLIGGGNLDAISSNFDVVPVAISSFLVSFSGNILAGLRDVDKDPLVGNQTLPVRLGPQRAFKLVGILACIDSALIVWLAAKVPDGYRSLLLLAIALILMGTSFRPILRTYGDAERSRVQRIADMQLWLLGKDLKLISLVCVFSLPIGLTLGLGLRALRLLFQKSYKRQIIEGGLLMSLSGSES